MKLQLDHLKKEIDLLQGKHGHRELSAIYGAGCISNPQVLFLFMNPTARNVSAFSGWRGIRAPWLGTKNVWKIFKEIGALDNGSYEFIKKSRPEDWPEDFALNIYEKIARKSMYVTNLAKCTQKDARKLGDSVFKQYLKNTLEEIYEINPKKIISFGGQVSSILLAKNIKISDYENGKAEILEIKGSKYEVYPVYYPVGQGMRNMAKAIKIINGIML